MSWKVIKTQAEYTTAIKRTMEIFHAAENTPEADELDLLLVLVKDYEEQTHSLLITSLYPASAV